MKKVRKSKDSIKLKEVNENLLQAHIIGKMGSWKWNLATGKVEWSKMMYDIFKIDSEDKSIKLEDAIENVMHPDDLHIVRAANAESFAPDKTVQYRIIWPDKSIRYIMAHTGDVVKDHNGNPTYITGMVQDITNQIIKDIELRDSEERFSLMFSKHSSIMLLIEQDSGKIIDANLAAQDFYGYTIEHLCKMNINEINVMQEDALKYERRKASREENNYFVFTHKLKSGEVRTVEAHSSPIDYKGSISLFSIINDITERTNMEILIRKERGRFKNIIESANVGTWEINLKTKEVKLNSRWAEIIGYTLEELHPFKVDVLSELVHPEDLKITREMVRKVFSDEIKFYNIEIRLKHKNGEWIWVEVKAKVADRAQDGSPLQFSGSNLEISARKKTEIALEESERNFHDIFETIEDIILVASKEGEIFYSNVSAQKKLGYSSEELKNMHVLDLNPAEKRAEAEQIFGDMFSGKRTICPLPLVKKDGKEIPSETRIWFGKWNGRECIFAIVKDLSTEQFALDKFQKIFQGNPALMSLSNVSDGKFTEVNNAFLKSVGYSKEEIIGKTSEELDLFVDKNLRVRVGELLSNRGTMSNVEMDIRKKNGEIINGLFFGEIIENEKERAFLNVMLDATESRNAVAQLRESERILKEKNILQRMVTDISRDLISANMKNIDGKINDILKTVGEFLGIDRCYIFRMLEGKKMVLTNEWHQKGLAPIWFVNPEISFEDFEAWAEKLKRENNIYIPDIRNIKENEQQQITIFGNLKIKSLLNIKIMNNDKLDGFFGFASTITYKEFRYDQIELLNIMANSLSDAFSRIKMEAELLLAKQKAEMDNALKTDFFVNMSHELRTPINVMRSSIQLLELKICKAEDEESKKILKQLKLMNRNSMRITRLVNNIIDVAKIDSGFYEPAFENVDIVKIIKKIFLSINQYAKQKMIKLTFVADQEGEIIKCDVAMIERIMLNVISNAIKYSKKGGYIKISVYKKPATISISVKDNGIGIEKEMQEIIFERYRQANPKLLQKSEGSGIGLSLAKSLVEIHGGTIQVISQYGEGSEFIIELPKELLENEKSPPIHYDENDELKVFMANVDIEMADLDFN